MDIYLFYKFTSYGVYTSSQVLKNVQKKREKTALSSVKYTKK